MMLEGNLPPCMWNSFSILIRQGSVTGSDNLGQDCTLGICKRPAGGSQPQALFRDGSVSRVTSDTHPQPGELTLGEAGAKIHHPLPGLRHADEQAWDRGHSLPGQAKGPVIQAGSLRALKEAAVVEVYGQTEEAWLGMQSCSSGPKAAALPSLAVAVTASLCLPPAGILPESLLCEAATQVPGAASE